MRVLVGGASGTIGRATVRIADVTDPVSITREAWAIEHQAQLNVLAAPRQAGALHFVLFSAICVQKPMLALQYATESMLVFDAATGRYGAEATPSTGNETLLDFQAKLARGGATIERGDHAVF